MSIFNKNKTKDDFKKRIENIIERFIKGPEYKVNLECKNGKIIEKVEGDTASLLTAADILLEIILKKTPKEVVLSSVLSTLDCTEQEIEESYETVKRCKRFFGKKFKEEK